MSGLNKVMIIGRLGRDPEMRYTPDGIAIANFSVATSEDWKDKNTGEKKEKTEWHRVVAFRRLAEVCGEYLVKGKQVYVEGKLNTRSWEKDGITRYITEITADRVQFLDSGRSSQDSSALQSGQESSNTPNTATSNSGYDYINTPADDDIPF